MQPEYKSYTQTGDAWMKATGMAKFLRTCKIWQLFKFAYYNLKIMKMLKAGH